MEPRISRFSVVLSLPFHQYRFTVLGMIAFTRLHVLKGDPENPRDPDLGFN